MRQESHESWLRAMTTQELQDRLEMYGWDRAEVEDHKGDWADIYECSSAYFDYMISTIITEIERRNQWTRRFAVNRNLKLTGMGRERFDAVKRAVPITTLLWEFGAGAPTPAGNRQIMRCPLGTHDDPNPSFTVYPGDAGWYCFGCNQGGTVIDLAMHLLRSNDPREALAHLESLARDTYGRERKVTDTLERLAAYS